MTDSTCIIWPGARNSKGYGTTTVAGKTRYAHRLAWEKANGRSIPEGMFVCHRCDNPPCINPEHLFVGTNSENLQDSIRKGLVMGFRPGNPNVFRKGFDPRRNLNGPFPREEERA